MVEEREYLRGETLANQHVSLEETKIPAIFFVALALCPRQASFGVAEGKFVTLVIEQASRVQQLDVQGLDAFPTAREYQYNQYDRPTHS